MQVTFKNLGPIQEVDIDLSKRINVVVGENGVGKTYLTNMLYGIMDTQYEDFNFLDNKKIKDHLLDSYNANTKTCSINLEDFLITDKKIKGKNTNHFISNVFPYKESKNVFKDFSMELKNVGDILEYYAKNEMSAEFFDLIISKQKNSMDIQIKFQEDPRERELDFLTRSIFPDFLLDCISESFILPAERGAVNIFNKELSIRRNEAFDRVLELADNNTDSDTLPSRMSRLLSRSKRYTLPVRNLLLYADDLYDTSQNDGEFKDIAEKIGQDVLNGVLSVQKDGEVFFTHNKAKTKKMPLDTAASTVKSMAGIIFFMKHTAKKGMTLFIDEPELNLHPNNQIKLTRVLVQMANSGIKLFVSTHSDYIIREFNNMIIADNVKTQNIYVPEQVLHNADIDVTRLYYKKHNSRYVTAEKVKIENDGFTVESIDKAIIAQDANNEDLSIMLD